MKLALIQFKPKLGAVDENFERASRLIESSMIDRPDVIVLPELWSTGFFPTPLEQFADQNGRRTSELLSGSARIHRVNIVGGTTLVRDGNNFFNRNLNFDRNGSLVAKYDKIHLFSMSGEDKIFTAGSSSVVFELDGVKCSTIVCYDLRFPELSRQLALNGVEVMFVPAAWPLKRLEHWRVLNLARAIENQMFVAAVNSAGHSMPIDPWGEVMIESGAEEKILTAELELERIKEVRAMMSVFADRKIF